VRREYGDEHRGRGRKAKKKRITFACPDSQRHPESRERTRCFERKAIQAESPTTHKSCPMALVVSERKGKEGGSSLQREGGQALDLETNLRSKRVTWQRTMSSRAYGEKVGGHSRGKSITPNVARAPKGENTVFLRHVMGKKIHAAGKKKKGTYKGGCVDKKNGERSPYPLKRCSLPDSIPGNDINRGVLSIIGEVRCVAVTGERTGPMKCGPNARRG